MVMLKDLTDMCDCDYQQRIGEFILCPECGYGMGGTRGDYWYLPIEYVFKCGCGNTDLQLVRRITKIEIIKG